MLFAPFESLPSPVAVAVFTNVPVWVTRALRAIVALDPGAERPEAALEQRFHP